MMNIRTCKKTPRRPANKKLKAHLSTCQPGTITVNLRETATEIEDWKASVKGPLNDVMADWTAPQYLLSARRELAQLQENSDRLRLLQQMVRDAVALQRGGYWTPRIQLDRDRLALEQEKIRLASLPPEAKKRRDVTQPLTDEERMAIIAKVDEVLGIQSQLPAPCVPNEPQRHGDTEE